MMTDKHTSRRSNQIFRHGLCLLVFTNLLFCSSPRVAAQVSDVNRFRSYLNSASNDTDRNRYLDSLLFATIWMNTDTGIMYAEKKLNLARQANNKAWESAALAWYGYGISYTGNYPLAIEYVLQGLKIAEELNLPDLKFNCYGSLTEIYRDQGDLENALYYVRRRTEYTPLGDSIDLMEDMLTTASIYEKLNNLDSAMYYNNRATELEIGMNGTNKRAYIFQVFGNIYQKKRQYDLARSNYRQVIVLSRQDSVGKDLIDAYNGLSKTFILEQQMDSALYYARLALDEGRHTNFQVGILETYGIISSIYETVGDKDSTIRYLGLTMQAREKMFNQANVRKIQSLAFQQALDRQGREAQKREYQSRIRQISLLAALVLFMVILALLYRNNRHKQKAKQKIEKAYDELKATQTQLIHSEKMASLGELTAGIAHEIQNPLNFVKNFSEVNNELIGEMKASLKEGKIEEAMKVSDDIERNLDKINEHGRRADSIVKGMLQHSRTSNSQKELTNINALCEEWLRLSYHGMRAKEKEFNVMLEKNYDPNLKELNLVRQDMGRVLMNIYNNAFYAVNDRKKKQGNGYEPKVSVSTKEEGGKVAITIRDNGGGIPEKVRDKIFQPFFTTKPPGMGTGLGLSLSYDIVKAHGGEIRVESQEGEGCKFTITLNNK